jgi:hypothetical protein
MGLKSLNKNLHAFHSSPNTDWMIITRSMRWAKHVARMEGAINTYRVLVGESKGKRPRGRRRQCWDGNIKTDLKEI